MRAPCRACYRESALTRRGLVWWHRAYGYLSVSLGPCPGAGRPPYGVLAEAVAPLLGQRVHPEPWRRESRDLAGTCYLLHFDAPFSHARHYLGWAAPGNLSARLAHHAAGSGANLLRHVTKAGIGWELTRTWPGDRTLERRLKNRGGHARLCPACLSARPSRQPGIGGLIIGGPVDAGSHARRNP